MNMFKYGLINFFIIQFCNISSGWPHYLNDIALVKLKQPVQLDASIKPACLHSTYLRLRKEFEAIGWGKLGNEGISSEISFLKFIN